MSEMTSLEQFSPLIQYVRNDVDGFVVAAKEERVSDRVQRVERERLFDHQVTHFDPVLDGFAVEPGAAGLIGRDGR